MVSSIPDSSSDSVHAQVDSFQHDVLEVINLNRGWKLATELLSRDSSVARSLRGLKNRKQVQLLRKYAPDKVYLKHDTETDSEEPLYGLILRSSFDGYRDAAHLPVRMANEYLNEAEIEKFS